ncbi:hypothetical protein BegalDRAFT_2036 [Beggiatoa alba B18LD]|uniref:Anti sigma-E protein RseA n=1 Tax=Beggiatoa alba B18LD TaxID=395493 RepID=I3CH09_9GAMM|nr:hypothetical protein [Beggiatoa alba]EIJ42902.1 hypothetical protein BegalDRAFT_2036 [Beggiatoa alba B18LD]
MSNQAMTIERFAQRLAAYGANLERWAITERQAARELLENSQQAKDLLIDAQRLDKVLDQLPDCPLPPLLSQRILQEIQQTPQENLAITPRAIVHVATPSRKTDWSNVTSAWVEKFLWGNSPTQHFWRPAFALVLPLVVGIWLGSQVQTEQQINSTSNEQVLEQIVYDEWNAIFGNDATTTNEQEFSSWL